MSLKKIISGGQSGSDLSFLVMGKKFGYLTGGTMPFGYKALDSLGKTVHHPEYHLLYGVKPHSSSGYPARTRQNVMDGDGTMRIAGDFSSVGEKLTLKLILQYKKPYFDVDINNPPTISSVFEWIESNNIKTLNGAGNSEFTCPGIFDFCCDYLEKLFQIMKKQVE